MAEALLEAIPAEGEASAMVRVTGREVSVGSLDQWFESCHDEETTLAIHRWGWLLSAGDASGELMELGLGLRLIRSWMEVEDRAPADAYSCAERIGNAYVFFRAHQHALPADVRAYIARASRRIAGGLEYHAGRLTGNHLLNNARGLVIAGAILDCDDTMVVGSLVARDAIQRVIDREGSLNEGSSHYQFVVTRWLLEMIIAKAGFRDGEVEEWISHARAMLAVCEFLIVQDGRHRPSIPLIGDVSPDSVPDWLVYLPWSSPSRAIRRPQLPEPPHIRGWSSLSLEGGALLSMEPIEGAGVRDTRSATSRRDDWVRLKKGAFDFITREGGYNGSQRTGHFHEDAGSFALFYEGVPLIVDPGRHSYVDSSAHCSGKSFLAHNSVSVNNLPACIEGDYWLASGFRSTSCGIRRIGDGLAEEGIRIHIDGYRRLRSQVSHVRTATITNGGLVLADRLSGTGGYVATARLHFSPAIEVSWLDERSVRLGSTGFVVRWDNGSGKLIFGDAGHGAWAHMEYGVCTPIWALVIEAHSLRGDIALNTEISIEG
jgi:hypothetical protein